MLITVDFNQVIRALDALVKEVERKAAGSPAVMREIADAMTATAAENFKREGRPPWPDIAPSTKEARRRRGAWPGDILNESGALAGSIASEFGADFAFVGTDVPYAAALQFGTEFMPARPFLTLTNPDMEWIAALYSDFLGDF